MRQTALGIVEGNGRQTAKKCTIILAISLLKWDLTKNGFENARMESKVVFGPKQLMQDKVNPRMG